MVVLVVRVRLTPPPHRTSPGVPMSTMPATFLDALGRDAAVRSLFPPVPSVRVDAERRGVPA